MGHLSHCHVLFSVWWKGDLAVEGGGWGRLQDEWPGGTTNVWLPSVPGGGHWPLEQITA